MQDKIVFWLPGDTSVKQHNRLQVILNPVLEHLRRLGLRCDFAGMLTDSFDDCAGDVNIWLATELGEVPPNAGRHILWFLSQMKIMPHTALLAYDAIFTASLDHFRFLQAWVGDVRPVLQLGWPLPPVEKPTISPRKKGILIDYSGVDLNPACVRQSRLPAKAQDLANLLAGYDVVKTNLILRERMCGFYGFEEMVAVHVGCTIQSEQRQGLDPALAPFFQGHKAQQNSAAAHSPDPAALDAFCANSAPNLIAQHIYDTVANFADNAPVPAEKTPAARSPVQPAQGPLSEVDAFFRDCDVVMTLWRKAETSLRHMKAAAVDIATPWNTAIAHPFLANLAPKPWTSLSLARVILEQFHAGQYEISPEDYNRLAQIFSILQRFTPHLNARTLPLAQWPTIPWTRVAEECQDISRDYAALSRAVNGHNIYQFSQSVRQKKKLSPYIGAETVDPAPFLSKTGIFLHGFYVDVAEKIIQRIHGHLAGCPIFVSTDTEEKRADLQQMFQRLNWPTYRVDVVENIGRDVYPKLFHMANDHLNFEFALHLHTKKSPHSSSLASWGMETVDVLAKDTERLGQIAHAFQADARLGAVYADPPESLHPAMSWTRNLRLAEILAASLGISNLPPGDDVDFPVGSMFWARTDALRIVQQRHIHAQHFVPEAAQEDGTLAHALERVVGIGCWARGYHMARCGASLD